MYPGNSGASKTRALVCELLAIKLLKEFSTRELVCLSPSTGMIIRQANKCQIGSYFRTTLLLYSFPTDD